MARADRVRAHPVAPRDEACGSGISRGGDRPPSRGARFARGLVLSLVAASLLVVASPASLGADRIDLPGPQPEGITSDGTHLWAADFYTGKIYRVNPDRPDSIRAYDAPAPEPEGLAWDGFRLWAASWKTRRIYMLRVEENALVVERTLETPGGGRPVGLTWDGVSLWVTTWRPFLLLRLDPTSGGTLFSRDIHPDADPIYPYLGGTAAPEDLAWDGSHLWITDWYTATIYRLDPATLAVVTTIPAAGRRSVGLTFHQGALWNGDTEEDALFRVLPTPVRATGWGGVKSGAVRRP